MKRKYWYMFAVILVIQCFAVLWYQLEPALKKKPTKYVGFHLNYGRIGNQIYHLITGYGIARTLGRIHYLPFEKARSHVLKYLKILDEVFPKLHNTYVLSTNTTNQTLIPFAGSCCAYDDPARLLNNSADYLLLDITYAQNPRYFEKYLPEVRHILRFSDKVRIEGEQSMDELQLTESRMLCIHTRMTDFVKLNVSTDANETVRAANNIAKKEGISRFMIFGDDQGFMKSLSKMIVEGGKWQENAVIISKFNEVTDFYVSSQVCRSFLITAATSSFGWWLAFFIKDQNAVYYMPDNRPHADKVPSKELFLKTWQQYDG